MAGTAYQQQASGAGDLRCIPIDGINPAADSHGRMLTRTDGGEES
jgi:hypothetical protein